MARRKRPPATLAGRARRHWRRRAAKLALLCVALGVGLLLSEGVVRISGTAPDVIPIGVRSEDNVYRRSTNAILSYEYKPGYRTDDESIPPHYRRINSHGLRDIERQFAKPPGTKRIILLGDSVVVGYGCPEIDQLMSRQLEELYEPERIEVLNMAVTGYCTRAEIELLKTKGLRYDPDLVVLVFVENDFRNFNPESVGSDGLTHRPQLVSSLFQGSDLFRLACLRWNWFGFGLEADPERWNQEAIGDNNVVDGLRLLRELADEHEFEAVVALWPGFENDEIDYPEKMFVPGSSRLIAAELARAAGIRVVGLREPFREHWLAQSPRPNPRLHYTIGDEMHPSAEGHRVAAEILHRVLQEQQLLQSREQAIVAQRNVAEPVADAKAAIDAAAALGTGEPDYGLVHMNRAERLQKRGSFDEAANLYRQIIDSDSLFSNDARAALAVILGEQGELDEAQEQLRHVLKEDPEHVRALTAMGVALANQGQADEAVRFFRQAVTLRPELSHVQLALGTTLMKLERWDEALEPLRQAAESAPGDVEAANAYGVALAHAGRYREAAEQFRRTLTLDPANATAQANLRLALSRLLDQKP